MEYFSFQWHISDNCDQRCQHCYIFAEKDKHILNEMSLEQLKHTFYSCLDFCAQTNQLPYFYITGGDPILHKHFWNLLELIKSHEIPFTILGNPFHLNDKVCLKLKEFGCEKYQLSLDGMKDTHDLIRKPGSFDATLKSIAYLNHAGIRSAVMATVSSMNIDEIPDLIDLVVEHEVDVFAFARYCPTNEEKTLYVPPQKYRDFLDRCWKRFNLYKDKATVFSLKDHLWKLYLYEEGVFKIPDDAEDNCIYDGCHCGASHLTILPQGDVYACRRMESKIGNVFNTSLNEIFNSNRMEFYRNYDAFKKCSKCELLRFCRGCPAVAYGYSNDFYSEDPQCWKQVD